MNTKSRLFVKHAERAIVMNATFAKMSEDTRSDEYEFLQKVKMENPGFTVCRRQIKSNPKKDTYKGLTYEWMRNHIATHEPKAVVEEKLKAFDEKIYISQCHGQSLRYPTIKKWFLAQYPDVAKFGTIEVDAQNEDKPEELKSQNAVPVNEVPYFNDVQTPAVNVLQ